MLNLPLNTTIPLTYKKRATAPKKATAALKALYSLTAAMPANGGGVGVRVAEVTAVPLVGAGATMEEDSVTEPDVYMMAVGDVVGVTEQVVVAAVVGDGEAVEHIVDVAELVVVDEDPGSVMFTPPTVKQSLLTTM